MNCPTLSTLKNKKEPQCSSMEFSCFFCVCVCVIYLYFLFSFCLCCVACGILVPDQGLNPGSLQWKHRAITTGPLGKFPY